MTPIQADGRGQDGGADLSGRKLHRAACRRNHQSLRQGRPRAGGPEGGRRQKTVLVKAQAANLDLANACVGSHDVEAGRIGMQCVAGPLKGEDDIAIIRGSDGGSAEGRRAHGSKEFLQKCPDMKALFEQTAN